MDVPSLKKTHPQKYYFKKLCKFLYYLGVGDIWYEKTDYYTGKIYIVWRVISNCYILFGVIDELLSYFRSDLTDMEKNDLILFTFAHPLICGKVLTLYFKKERIQVVMERLLEGTRSTFNSLELEKASVRHYAWHCFSLTSVSYLTVWLATIEGVRTYVKEEIPIRTEVVFFPSPSETGVTINVLRFFVVFHWYCIVTVMASIDCLALCSLITVSHKFRVLRLYFDNLRTKILENKSTKTRKELDEEFKQDFVVGIKMHADALWCARNVQKTMGPLYSIQVLESVAVLVMCLIKLVTVERNLIYLLAQLTFIVCVIILTGCYMMAAGDITHEASLVGTSIFHSGWEHCLARADLRVLVVVALQQSQVPVYMTAFGVLTLSHTNLISVLRSSYSFFAVMY